MIKVSKIFFNGKNAAGACSQYDPHPFLIIRTLVKTGRFPGLSECNQAELITSGEASNLLFRKMGLRVQMGNLCGDLRPVGRGIKDGDLLCPVSSLDEGVPELGEAISHGTDHTQTCDHNPFLHFTLVT